ncbi:transposase [Kitasatospora sp. NPDC091207]|uniref:transposase n=1 Tax=Kitasatospora sp. NPDC091207 TaxID=3364083 RepID=UPI00380B7098
MAGRVPGRVAVGVLVVAQQVERDDHAVFQDRDLSDRDFVHVWADGVHPKVRLGQAHSCVLVLLGVRLDGTKELIALAEVFPAARHQRCWVHKAPNVTNCLPNSAQPGASKAMQEIYDAEDRAYAEKAVDAFAGTFGAKWPETVAKITEGREELLAFHDFPAEHWVRLRTTDPMESTFSTVKLRTKVTRGAGSPAAALAMVCKLVEPARARRRAITGAHLVALVRSGARFDHGVLVERSSDLVA